jgi:hypothetical protein
MAKRFTDSTKWNKPFIRGLDAPYKLLWFYILDDCDHAGIWQVDIDVAKIRIGCDIDFNEAVKIFGDHIQVLDDGQKWYIADFIDFQYGELNPDNRVHQSVLTIHKKYKIKPLRSPLKGAMDKDKDKDTDKDKENACENPFDSAMSEFKKMRVKMKAPLTDYAEKLLMSELEKLAPNDLDLQVKILEQSISKSWRGVFALKSDKSYPNNSLSSPTEGVKEGYYKSSNGELIKISTD